MAPMTTITYQHRIDALRQTKKEHTEMKRQQRGFYDIDDHGWIPWPEPVAFTPKSNHPDGRCYGAKCIGENFRAWLEVHPVYIHPMSALAGAWIRLRARRGRVAPGGPAGAPDPHPPRVQHHPHRHRRDEPPRPRHEDRPRPGVGRSAAQDPPLPRRSQAARGLRDGRFYDGEEAVRPGRAGLDPQARGQSARDGRRRAEPGRRATTCCRSPT